MNPSSQPRFEQPFTLQEALQFEPGTITAEIARLQNSLQHLGETQSVLEEHVASDPDPDLLEALGDNRVVIAAQTERIGILRQALERKGVVSASNPHYDLPPSSGPTLQSTTNGGFEVEPPSWEAPSSSSAPTHEPPPNEDDDAEGGVFL